MIYGQVQQIRDLEGPGKGRDVQIAYGVRRGRRVCGASKPPPQKTYAVVFSCDDLWFNKAREVNARGQYRLGIWFHAMPQSPLCIDGNPAVPTSTRTCKQGGRRQARPFQSNMMVHAT